MKLKAQPIPNSGASNIVFVSKYRGKEIYGQFKTDIGEILRKLLEQKKSRNF